MEKTEQTPSNAPRRRRRRRGSGANAAQNQQTQQTSAAKEKPKANPSAAQGKASRQNPPRSKESGKETKEAPVGRGRHRNPPAEPAASAQNTGRRTHSAAPAPVKENGRSGKQPQRTGRAAHRAAEEDPGLELIARRPPKQKFANFEEYLAAHGGMTVPLPEEPSPELSAEKADTAALAGAAE